MKIFNFDQFKLFKLVTLVDLTYRVAVRAQIDLKAKSMLVADSFGGIVLTSIIPGEKLAENDRVVFESEICHKSERTLGEGYHRRDKGAFELLGSVQNGTVSTKRHNVSYLFFTFFS